MNALQSFVTKILQASVRNGRPRPHFNSKGGHPQMKTAQVSMATEATDSTSYPMYKVQVTQESMVDPGRTIDFEISVVDTHPGDSQRPLVFGIHGVPGWGLDFEPLIQQLKDNGFRFVAPTFQGYETSEIDTWKLYHLNYNTRSLASLVEQIFRKLEFQRVTMLMCHSAGSWVGYQVAAESDRVQSLCLLNPVGHRPHRALRPQFAIHTMAWLVRRKSLHFLFLPLMEFAYAFVGFKGVKAGEHLMVTQQVVAGPCFTSTQAHARRVWEKQLPLLFAYTLNDKIIEADLFEEMLYQHLHVPNVWAIDAKGNQTQLAEAAPDQDFWFAQGLQFERGGHIAHKAYGDIIFDRVLKILHHVKDSQ